MDIDLEGQFRFVVADVIDRLEAGLVRRVIDEDIDPAVLRYGLGDDCAALARILDVAGQQDSRSAGFFHQTLGLPGVLVLVKMGYQDVQRPPWHRRWRLRGRYRYRLP